MPEVPTPNGWEQYQKLVLKELESHSQTLKEVNKELNTIRVEIAGLKVKAGIWGMAAGFIPAIIAVIASIFGGG